MLPPVGSSTPGTTFGRWPWPSRLVLLVFWVTPIGKPLCIWITNDTVQPPAIALPTPLVSQRCPAPNGRRMIGLATSLCGESSRLRPYSASGLKYRTLGIGRVVVQDAGQLGVVVALAELVVVEAAVGVADAAAPPPGGALADLDHAGVILRPRQRAVDHVDVVELRERPQQLVAGNGRARWRTRRRPGCRRTGSARSASTRSRHSRC